MKNKNLKKKAKAEDRPIDVTETFDMHYIKSSDFKTLPVSGGYGGVTGYGYINLNLYLDRQPIPRRVTYDTVEGKLGDEIEVDSKKGSIREVHSGLIMDLQTAKNIRDWLDGKINDLEQIINPKKVSK